MGITKTQIKKWNDYFKSLTKPQQRVAIAEDVIQQVKKKKYTIETGNYVKFNEDNFDFDLDIQSNFDKVNCSVCALGACLLSTTKFKNKLTFDDVSLIDSYSSTWNLFLNLFTSHQLLLIENAFEGVLFYSCRVGEDKFTARLTEKEEEKCNLFYDKYFTDDTKRLIAIMENIIANNGTFKP